MYHTHIQCTLRSYCPCYYFIISLWTQNGNGPYTQCLLVHCTFNCTCDECCSSTSLFSDDFTLALFLLPFLPMAVSHFTVSLFTGFPFYRFRFYRDSPTHVHNRRTGSSVAIVAQTSCDPFLAQRSCSRWLPMDQTTEVAQQCAGRSVRCSSNIVSAVSPRHLHGFNTYKRGDERQSSAID